MTDAARRYDLYFTAGGRRFYFRNDHHGVTLGGHRIAWRFDGRDEEAPLETVAAVHLESGGDWQNAVNACRITFRSGNGLTISDAGQYGTADGAQTPLYRSFVRDLHARLAAAKSTVDYTAGYGPARYNVVLVCAVLLGLMAVALPFVLLFIVQKLEVLYLLAIGIALTWPLYKMVAANAPRRYDPRHLPKELMQ